MKKRIFNFAVKILLVVIVILSGYLLSNHFFGRTVWKDNDFIKPKYFSQLNGEVVKNASSTIPQVVGVMIDNHPAAWPQAGIDEAKIIYEAPAEGDITRFIALFTVDQIPAKVGPVRSARPYYLDWLREYGDALYMHSGGSPQALNQIKTIGIFDANEFWWGKYYWRDNIREAPHNLYTSGANWQKLISVESVERVQKNWSGWKFVTGTVPTSTGFDISKIDIKYRSDYHVGWQYLAEQKMFKRLVNNQDSVTVDGNNLWANTIIVQTINAKIIDNIGRLEMTTIGDGDAKILSLGKISSVKWNKKSATERTRFFDKDGQEILLNPGKIWVVVVSPNTNIQITN